MTRFRTLLAALCLVGLAFPATAQTSINFVTPRLGTATLTSAIASIADACTATSCVQLGEAGYTAVSVQTVGTCGTCTLNFEATNDGAVWVAVSLMPVAGTAAVSSITTAGIWQGAVSAQQFRVRQSAWSSGGFVVTARATLGTASVAGTGGVITGVVPIANGGTNVSSAGIASFNSTTGYTAAGATGTTSTNLVFSTSPTITTPTFSGVITTSGAGVAVANVGAASCGSTAAAIAGNQDTGEITVGATSGTQCRVTFTTTAANRRNCLFTDETTKITVLSTYVDTTHNDVSGVFVAGDTLTYHCLAR